MTPEVKIQFKVFYKAQPHYEGPFQRDKLKAPGLHGTFDTIADAREQAEKCKAWFQTEKICKNPQASREKQEFQITIHDNVLVWVEEWRDGSKYTPPEAKKVA